MARNDYVIVQRRGEVMYRPVTKKSRELGKLGHALAVIGLHVVGLLITILIVGYNKKAFILWALCIGLGWLLGYVLYKTGARPY